MSAEYKKIIDAALSKPNPHVWFDIDGTLKHTDSLQYPDKFNPAVTGVLVGLNELASTGASTDQSPFELSSFLEIMMKHVSEGQQIFTGPSVLEGGHILVPVAGKVGKDFKILTSQIAQEEMKTITKKFGEVWQSIPKDENGWGLLPGVQTPVALAQGKYQGVGSVSIWEKGGSIHDPEYKGEYEPVMAWVKNHAVRLGISHLDFVEVGNGTLRIIENGKSKANLIQVLHEEGAVDLASSVYVGDGINDVEPATLVKIHGGTVIAVANAYPDLKELADIVTEGIASDGVVEALKLVV